MTWICLGTSLPSCVSFATTTVVFWFVIQCQPQTLIVSSLGVAAMQVTQKSLPQCLLHTVEPNETESNDSSESCSTKVCSHSLRK